MIDCNGYLVFVALIELEMKDGRKIPDVEVFGDSWSVSHYTLAIENNPEPILKKKFSNFEDIKSVKHLRNFTTPLYGQLELEMSEERAYRELINQIDREYITKDDVKQIEIGMDDIDFKNVKGVINIIR